MTDQPPIGSVQGKIWGTTQRVFAFNGTDSHLIHIVKGGFCSRHFHLHKWNRFLVLSGRLIVRIFGEGTADETIMKVGMVSDVPPGVRHEFEALEPTVAMEFYWTVLEETDIDRDGTVGGIKS